MKDFDSRLTQAAANARDELRALIPKLDAAIASGLDSTGLLSAARGLMAKHAGLLSHALKRPTVQPRRGNRDSRLFQPAWAIDGKPVGERYREPERKHQGPPLPPAA
jgi:hypothetical protein